MRPSFVTILIVCLLSTLLLSCHKHDELKTQSTYTFSNQTGRRVTFDIYPGKEDYNTNTNRIQQYFIEPGANQQITFDVMSKYWIDWYSADYSFHNWQSTRSSYNRSNPVPELNIAAEDDAFAMKASTLDTARSVLLNGGGISSTWLATISTNALLNGQHKFIFRKDFTGEYTYTNLTGGVSITPFEYMVSSGTTSLGIEQRFILSILNAQLSTIFQFTCTPGFLFTPHTGRDTMMVRFQQISGLPEYPAARQ